MSYDAEFAAASKQKARNWIAEVGEVSDGRPDATTCALLAIAYALLAINEQSDATSDGVYEIANGVLHR